MHYSLTKYFFSFYILSFLTGCYCFMEGSSENVQYLNGTKFHRSCEWRADGLAKQVNVYYGIPSSDLNYYKENYIDKTASSSKINSFGPLGIRGEYYCSPFGIIPYSVMGLGFDYSYSKARLSYNNTNYSNDLTFNNHRVMLSANLMTFARGDLISYFTLQGGCNFMNRKKNSSDPGFVFKESQRSPNFEYRIGQGFQYYLGNVYALVVEGGYGGGAYIRTGFCFWF